MSKLIATAPALILATTAAPAYAQSFDWTGFYAGAHGAVVDADPQWDGANIYQTVDGGEGGFTTTEESDAISESPGSSEIGGGARIGFNWQAGAVVLGAEADATFFDFDGIATQTSGPASYTVASHASNLQTVRARAGVAFGSAMLFATGGVAFSNLEHSLTATNTSEVLVDGGEGGTTVEETTANLASVADSGTGWAFGGGGEVRLTENLTIAATVLHVDFGSETLSDSEAPSSVSATVDTSLLVGMLGFNFTF